MNKTRAQIAAEQLTPESVGAEVQVEDTVAVVMTQLPKSEEAISMNHEKLITERKKIIEQLFADMEKIADVSGISFYFDGPAYGMGGWYQSNGWQASSQSC